MILDVEEGSANMDQTSPSVGSSMVFQVLPPLVLLTGYWRSSLNDKLTV